MDEGTTEIILKVPSRTEPMTFLTPISTWNFDNLPTAWKIFSAAVTPSPVAEQPPLNTSFMYGCIQWQAIFHIYIMVNENHIVKPTMLAGHLV